MTDKDIAILVGLFLALAFVAGVISDVFGDKEHREPTVQQDMNWGDSVR